MYTSKPVDSIVELQPDPLITSAVPAGLDY